jgi:chromosome segregation ATPase
MAQPESAKRSVTIGTELERLKAEIQENEAASLSRQRQAERLRNDFADLQRLDSERKQTLDRYSAALKSSEKEIKEFRKYYETNNTMIQAALKRKKADIDREIDEFDSDLKKQEQEVNAMKEKSEIAKRDYESAKQVHDDRLKKYRDLLSHQQTLEATLREAASLKEQIEKEENVTKKYFLNEEIKKILQRAKMKSFGGLSDELNKAWRAVKSAKEHLDEKEDKFNEANANAKSSETHLEVLRKNRREEILSRI